MEVIAKPMIEPPRKAMRKASAIESLALSATRALARTAEDMPSQEVNNEVHTPSAKVIAIFQPANARIATVSTAVTQLIVRNWCAR